MAAFAGHSGGNQPKGKTVGETVSSFHFLDIPGLAERPARSIPSAAARRLLPGRDGPFPVADEEQFEFIKQIIDESDYYIIISAGRYGSIHPETGLSYNEMEYDYAVETGKPVIRLLHKDPFNELRGELVERTDEQKKKLSNFRDKLSASRLVAFWRDASELGQQTVYAL